MAGEPVLTPGQPQVVSPLANAQPRNPAQTAGLKDPAFMDGLTKAHSQDNNAPIPKTAQPKSDPAPPKEPDAKSTEPVKKDTTEPSFQDALDKIMGKEPEPKPEDNKGSEPKPEPAPEYKPSTKAEQWKELHAEKESNLQRAVAAEERINRVRNEVTEQFQAEVQKIKSERDEVLKELELIAIERSPKFNEEFSARESAVMKQLQQTVSPAKAKEISELLKATPSDARDNELDDIARGLGVIKQRRFADLVAAYDAVRDERQFKIEESAKNWNTRQEQQVQKQQEHKAEINQRFDAVSNRWRETLTKTSDEVFNKEINEGIARAKSYMNEDLGEEDLAKVAHWAGAGPAFANKSARLEAENKELRATIQKYEQTNPDFSADVSTPEGYIANVKREIEQHGSGVNAAIADMQRRGILPNR